ncbi:MAG: phosphate acyltransferase PlsX [Christensenellales bacterium]
MKIVLDVYGADYSPDELIKGAIDAVNEEKGFELVLFGDKKEIEARLGAIGYKGERINVVDAPDVITNDDVPTEAVRKKTGSSLISALNYLNSDADAVGMVSAGSTGAVLTGAVLLLKRIKGVNRPALCPLLPTVAADKNVLLMDCGANVEPKPVNLVQFAVMASAYSKRILGVDNPRVGLLSNGAEDKKGNALNKETFPMLKECQSINFIGNIEGRDILSGNVDVVVCDGYSGNIALKSCEGTALSMFSMIKDGIMSGGLRAKIGYLLLKPVFKGIKKRMDYNDNGGAVLLGLEKIIVKSHGSSKAKAIKNSILQVKRLSEGKVVETIENELGSRG